MALTFADTHNMIAFLTKSNASEGFELIIDFLNASTNDVVRLQALIDKRKVIITEDAVRQALRLDDAKSIDCLPNEEIFAELARMGYEKPSTKLTFYKAFFLAQWKFLIHIILQCMSAKRTAWNELSSSMALVVICLATGMLVPQQVQVDIDATVAPILPPSPHQSPIALPSSPPQQQQHSQPSQTTTIFMDLLNTLLETYTTLTRKVENLEQDKIAQYLEITKLKQRVRRLEKKRKLKVLGFKRLRKGRLEESQAQVYHLDLEHAQKVLSMQDDEAEPVELTEVIEVVTTAKLMIEVVTAAATIITAAPMPAASAARRRKGVVIRDPEEIATPSVIVHSEPKSKDKGKGILVEEPKPLKKQAQIEHDEAYARELEAELNANINWNDVIEQVKRKEKQDNAVMRYQALKRKLQTGAQAKKNMMVYLKNMVGFKMDFFKGMSYDDIRPIFEKHFNSIVAFLKKGEEELEEEASKMILLVERRYPLTRFTLDQMLNNVRLEVKEEIEVSLELLRLTYCCWYKLKLLDNAADTS
nr:hypothetical protein [Tanacetum cinerariifolium]